MWSSERREKKKKKALLLLPGFRYSHKDRDSICPRSPGLPFGRHCNPGSINFALQKRVKFHKCCSSGQIWATAHRRAQHWSKTPTLSSPKNFASWIWTIFQYQDNNFSLHTNISLFILILMIRNTAESTEEKFSKQTTEFWRSHQQESSIF